MGLGHSPRIVTDGLVLALDAGNTKSLVNGDGDSNFSSVSLLLNGDGTNGSTDIVDTSSNNNTITVNGTAQISTAQSKFGGSSLHFTQATKDTPQNYLSLGSAISIEASEDFTIEFWAFKSSSGLYDGVLSNNNGLNNFIELSTARGFVVYVGGNGSTITATTAFGSGGSYADSTWHHYAVTRENNTRRIFIDGDLKSTVAGMNAAVTLSLVGTIRDVRYSFEGYLEDIRITKGVARYTSNFTPPTAALPGVATQWTDTVGGNTGTFISMNGNDYNSANGGALVFDGSNDYVDLANSNDYAVGTSGDITIEAWINSNSWTGTGGLVCLYQCGDATGLSIQFSSGRLRLQNYATEFSLGSTTLSTGQWYHIVAVRRGGSLIGYVNGSVENAAVSNTVDFSQNGPRIGQWKGLSGYYFDGKISNFKIYKNKGLTATEVKQNYNALKGRYA